MTKKRIVQFIAILLIIGGVAGYEYWKNVKEKREIARQEEAKRLEEQKKAEEKEKNTIKANTVTTKITTVPEKYYTSYVMSGNKLENIVFSKNGGGVAYKVVKNGKAFIVFNDKEGNPYDDVGKVAFSPDSQQISYAAFKSGKWFVLSGGKESKENKPYNYIDLPTYSPDGKTLAYFARANNKWFIVSNEQPGKSYDFSGNYNSPEHTGHHLASAIFFSPDSQKTAYIVKRSEAIKDSKGKPVMETNAEGKSVQKLKAEYFVAVNGQPGQIYDYIHGLAFSPDSQKLVYGAQKNGQWYLVVNSEESGPYNYSDIFSLAYGPDNNNLAKMTEKSGVYYVVVGDKQSPAPFYLKDSRVFIGADNETAAYAAKDGDKFFAVYGVKNGDKFDYIDPNSFVFSPDGTKIMYGALKGSELWWMVEDVK